VVSEENGVWGMAEEVPGTAALNLGEPPGSTRCRARHGAIALQPGGTRTPKSTSRRSSAADNDGWPQHAVDLRTLVTMADEIRRL